MNLFELFVKIGVDDQASDKISGLSSKLGKGLQSAAKAGIAAVSAVSSGIVALGTYATKVGSDFESQMSKVSAISGATSDDLQALEDKAKQLGIDTKFSATEAGQAFEYMAMAGWKTEQMLDGVAGIMDLAAASGEDLAMVSDIVTDAMTAFGLSAEQSTHFADVLAQASSNANTNVALLGESFKYVAPVAGALGYSVEDTATALGLMANAGIKGSQAGTALRAALSSMLDASDPVYAAMMQLGLATEDTVTALVNEDGTSKSLAETMGILRDAFSELTEAEQAEYAANIFGREAMSGMLAIINTSDAEFEKLTNSIYGADGAAKQMADTMANNLQGKFTLLKSSAEGFGLALYDKIQKPLTQMASWAVESLNKLTNAFNENGVDGVVEAAGNIVSEAVATVVEKLPEFVELAVSVIDSFVKGISENQETIANGAINIITTLTNGILNLLPDIIKLGLDLLVALAQGIAEALPTLLPTVIDVILEIVRILTDPETLGNLLQAAIDIIMALADYLLDPDTLNQLLDAVVGIVDSLVTLIMENLGPLLDAAINIIMALVEYLLDPENIGKLVEAATKIVVEIALALVGAAFKLVEAAFELIGKIRDAFTTADWGQIGKNIIDGLLNGIKNAWDTLSKWVTDAWNGLVGGIKDFLGIKSPSKLFAQIGGFMAEGVGVGWNEEFKNTKKDIEKSFDIQPILDWASKAFGVRFTANNANQISDSQNLSNQNALANSGISSNGGVNIVQNIYTSVKSPSELAASTRSYFEQARWALS